MSVCIDAAVCRGGGEGGQPATANPLTGPPPGSLRPALGWDPVAERWRLKRGSGGPTGTQLLCRSIGSFTACRITHNPVLADASQEHLLPTLPCPGHFTARQEAENNTRKILFTYRGWHQIKMGSVFKHYWALSLSREKASVINVAMTLTKILTF